MLTTHPLWPLCQRPVQTLVLHSVLNVVKALGTFNYEKAQSLRRFASSSSRYIAITIQTITARVVQTLLHCPDSGYLFCRWWCCWLFVILKYFYLRHENWRIECWLLLAGCSVLVVLFLVFLCHVLACCSRPAHTTGGRAQHPCPWRGRSNLRFLPPFLFFFSAFLPIAFLVLPLMSLGNASC